MEVGTIMVCLLSSTLAATVVSSIKDLVIYLRSRKDTIDSKKEEKSDRLKLLGDQLASTEKKLNELSDKVAEYMESHNEITNSIIRSNKLILQGKIEYLSTKFIHEGKISHEHRKLLHEMWNEYHYTWKGNGDLDVLMEAIDDLPLE